MILAARQLQQKCQEMRTHLYSTFMDLTKAFDTGNREGLWKIIQKFGSPERFIEMVRQLHDGMMARVTHQPTSAASASTVHTALAHSCTAWAYSATCVSTRAELTAAPTHPVHTSHLPCLALPLLRRPSRPPPAALSHPVHTAHPPCSAVSLSAPTTAISVANTDITDFSCPHFPRTFTLRIGLVVHLRIHHTETGEPVPGAPSYIRHFRLHCPHCPRTFTHRMRLFGHMRIHESGIDRPPDSPTTSILTLTSSPYAPTTPSATGSDATDLTCPHCPRTFTSRIGLVGHLRIHRTKTFGRQPPAASHHHILPHRHLI
ncbi:hypothetical protein SprV_0702409200 [Sparganum proliferum]